MFSLRLSTIVSLPLLVIGFTGVNADTLGFVQSESIAKGVQGGGMILFLCGLMIFYSGYRLARQDNEETPS